MEYAIKDDLLDGVPFRATPNMGGAIVPEILVIHYTATLNYKATVAALCSENLKASAHLVLSRDGEWTQLVPFNRKAWHAGASSYNGRGNCNGFSIGIEVMNPGYLRIVDGVPYDHAKRKWDGEMYHSPHKNAPQLKHWAAYTDVQIAELEKVARLLIRTYQLTDVVGHDDIAPGRKLDPGPAFPMRTFRDHVMNGEILDATETT